MPIYYKNPDYFTCDFCESCNFMGNCSQDEFGIHHCPEHTPNVLGNHGGGRPSWPERPLTTHDTGRRALIDPVYPPVSYPKVPRAPPSDRNMNSVVFDVPPHNLLPPIPKSDCLRNYLMVEKTEGRAKSTMVDDLGIGMSRPWPRPGTGVDAFNIDFPDHSQPTVVPEPCDPDSLAAGLQFASDRFARHLSAMTDIHKLAMVMRAEEKVKQAAKANPPEYNILQRNNHVPVQVYRPSAASNDHVPWNAPAPPPSRHGAGLPRNSAHNGRSDPHNLNTSIYSQYITTSASSVPPGFMPPGSYDAMAALRQIEQYTDSEMWKIITHLSCEASSSINELSANIKTMYHMIWDIYKANQVHQRINQRTVCEQSAVCYPASNQNPARCYATANQTAQIQQLQYQQATRQVVHWNNVQPHSWEPIPLPNRQTSSTTIGAGDGPYMMVHPNYVQTSSVNSSYPMNGAGDACQSYYQHDLSYRNGASYVPQGQRDDYNYVQQQCAPHEYVPTQNMNLQEYGQRYHEEAPQQRSYHNEFPLLGNNESNYHVEKVSHCTYLNNVSNIPNVFPEDGFMKRPYREIVQVPKPQHEVVRPPTDFEKTLLLKAYRESTPPKRLYRKAEPELRACYEKVFLQNDYGEDNLTIMYQEELAPKKTCRESVLEEAFFKNIDPLLGVNYEERVPKKTCHQQALEQSLYGKLDYLPKANHEEFAHVKSCKDQAYEQEILKKVASMSNPTPSDALATKKSFREQVLQHAFPDKNDSPRQTYKEYLEKQKFFRECIEASPKAYREEFAPQKSRRELMDLQGIPGQYYHNSFPQYQSGSDDSDESQENEQISYPKTEMSAKARGMQMQKLYHETRAPFVGYSSRAPERSALNTLVLDSASRNNLKKTKVAGNVLEKSLTNFPLLGSSSKKPSEEEEASNPLDTSFFLSLFKKADNTEAPGFEEASRRLYNRGSNLIEEIFGTSYKPVPRPLLLASDVVQSELDSNVDLKDFFMVTTLLSKKSRNDFDKFYIHQKTGNKDTEINSGEESIRRKAYSKYDFFGWGCIFCKKNNCSYEVYSTHQLRDPIKGHIICPYLRQHRCSLCHATGDHAHTRKHCPMYKFC